MKNEQLKIGDKIPLTDLEKVSHPALTKEAWMGRWVVIYFYPKDDTPGCTKEACSFRDHLGYLTQEDALVIGVSPDTAESHEKFSNKYQLNFNLVPDKERMLCNLFGVNKGLFGIERTTFLIDPQGVIRWIERPVKVNGHVERVLKALKAYKEG